MPYSEPPIIHLSPLEYAPEDVVIFDRGARRWAVRLSNTGQWVGLLRGASPGSPRFTPGTRLVTAFDARHALNLADAVQWAARIAEPRSLNI
jgi:hypothetical protein